MTMGKRNDGGDGRVAAMGILHIRRRRAVDDGGDDGSTNVGIAVVVAFLCGNSGDAGDTN